MPAAAAVEVVDGVVTGGVEMLDGNVKPPELLAAVPPAGDWLLAKRDGVKEFNAGKANDEAFGDCELLVWPPRLVGDFATVFGGTELDGAPS